MEKIWLNNYKPGIVHEITQDQASINDLFAAACANYATKRAITCHKVNLTFREVRERVARIAAGLRQLGVTKGDRVALILPNSLQYPLSVFAILALGACVVNINPLYTPNEIEYIVADAEPKVIITLDMFADKLNDFHNKYGIKQIVVSKIADPYPLVKRSLINFVLRYFAKVNPKLNYTPISWRQLYLHAQPLIKPERVVGDDLAFIQYTGATTGHPKGAMLLHRNIVSNIRQVFAVLEPQVSDLDQQIVICALPLYHIFSLTANLFTFFMHGGENVMVPNAKNIKDLVRVMNSTPFTIFNSLDTLYNKLLEYPPFATTRHPHYKYGICGGMPTRQSVANAWRQHTGLNPTNCYGLTETSPCVSMSYFDDEFNGSVGLPVPSTEIDIRDIEQPERSLAVGEPGLVLVRGPQVMTGYWRNPEQTAKALTADGWLRTGDVGYINERGQLVISSRETEMIIVSGFNVYPAEIERVIDELPEVYEVAIVGAKSSETGEAVHAFIVTHAGMHLTSGQVREHCRARLAKYKLPRTVTFVDELPKTLVGKIDKKLLAATYLTKDS